MDRKTTIFEPVPGTRPADAPQPPQVLSYYTPPQIEPPADQSPEGVCAFVLALMVGGMSLIAAIVPWQPVLLVCAILIIVTSPLVFFLGIAGLFDRKHKRSLAVISIPLLLGFWLLAMVISATIR